MKNQGNAFDSLIAALLGCGLLVLFGMAGSCRKDGEASEMDVRAERLAQTVTVDAKEAVLETIRITLDAVGTLEAAEDVEISTEVAGIVEKIHFEEGMPVQAGRELVHLDDDMALLERNQAVMKLERLKASLGRMDAEVRRYQAQAENAKSNFERKAELFEQDATTRATYLDAKTGYDAALAAVDEAKASLEESKRSIAEAEAGLKIVEERLSDTRILAPFDGILGERCVGPGDYVDLGECVVQLVAIDPLKANFTVPERYRGRIGMGQAITLTVEAWQDKSFEGEVIYISPGLDPDTRTVKVKAVVNNEESLLKPGFFCRIELIVDVKADAVVIPEEAIIPRGDDFFVYKVEAGQAKLVRVELGQRMAGRVEVTSGMQAGEWVITAGQQRVTDGTKVRIRKGDGKPRESDKGGDSAATASKES
ncbi:MAG: efflux RND transporter periplasmic adaptor subunit [Planctomycetota bacterium]|jgi:membrane fusion protein (multidrug efflux system)